MTPPLSLSLDPCSRSQHASLFLVTLLSNWEREQGEFREASKEQEIPPHTHTHQSLRLWGNF